MNKIATIAFFGKGYNEEIVYEENVIFGGTYHYFNKYWIDQIKNFLLKYMNVNWIKHVVWISDLKKFMIKENISIYGTFWRHNHYPN